MASQGMAEHRPVFIHASYLRPDQIQRMKKVGAVPSFLTTGLVSGGETVVKLWGEERAANAMAAATMLKNGIPFTFSHDAPVSPRPWVLPLVDAGVNRRTAQGLVIGPAERVTPYQALRAVTANAAWQIREEKSKGTLEVGKLADLVILERNPLTMDPNTIKDIAVLETIKEGRTIFRRDQGQAAALPKGLGGSLPCLHEHGHDEVAALTPKARRTLAELLDAGR
ncbi:MAG: amidohydrolase family protein [Prochlorococcaceae cyanobacterium]